METSLIRAVWKRASQRCEYCLLPAAFSLLPFEIDHIIAEKHGGATALSNLALACFYCNRYKGSNLAGIDPRTRALVRLFHPRRHRWKRHFRWNGPRFIGRTAVGRVTIAVLNMNEPEAVALRAALMDVGLYPLA